MGEGGGMEKEGRANRITDYLKFIWKKKHHGGLVCLILFSLTLFTQNSGFLRLTDLC